MTETRPKLVLIDGHGLAYQQYFALPVDKFTTTQGEPTNATYGFARTLLDILQMQPPVDYLAVSFDQGMSGRELTFPSYKSTRDKMEDDMLVQMNRIREVVQAFNIPILEKDGYEADDVIGTSVQQAIAQGVDVLIITGDRDLLQLVNEHVKAQLPSRRAGQTGPQLYDIERIVAEFGVRPEQIPDYKGLVGDNSDNIPGVRGIGEKTAAPLLQQYGTLENLYDHLDEQKGKQKEKLQDGRDSAFLSKRLAQIMIDIPLTLDLQKCVAHDYNADQILQLFRTLEFRSLSNRVAQSAQGKSDGAGQTAGQSGQSGQPGQQMDLFQMETPAPAPIAHLVQTIVVDTEAALADLVAVLSKAPVIAFDTETTSLDQMRGALVGISLAVNGDEGYYIPVGHVSPDGPLIGETPPQLPL
jgi:DNA polymerase-1